MSRRALVRRAVGLGAALLGLTGCARDSDTRRGRWAGRFLTVATAGGAARQALWAAAFVPFERATGCRVMDVNLPPAALVPELRRQVLVGQTQWDVAALDAALVERLATDDPPLLDRIDYRTLDRRALAAGLALDHGVGILSDTLALAYRMAPFTGRAPVTWAEVWDPMSGAFPGPRLFPRDPVGLLEVALLAAGVVPDRLYPLDLDRAFRALDRARPHVADWWRKTIRPGEALAQGEADFVLARGGDLRAAIAGGAIAALAPLPTPRLALALTLPRGGPNADIARDFLAHCLRPEIQAAFAGQGYTPALAGANAAAGPPTVPLDLDWWGAHGRAASARFEVWMGR